MCNARQFDQWKMCYEEVLALHFPIQKWFSVGRNAVKCSDVYKKHAVHEGPTNLSASWIGE